MLHPMIDSVRFATLAVILGAGTGSPSSALDKTAVLPTIFQ
jgi:hypothetical protein